MIQMFINDEEVVCDREFTINEEMLNTSSTILNNCYPKSWEETKEYTNNFYFPLDYSLCKILKDGELIFAGVVKNSGNISLNPNQPKYCSLQILDFKTFLSEGETLDFVIDDKTIREAIEMVIDAIQDYGVVLGNIDILNPDEKIGAYSTLNKTAYDVFQYIAEISQSKWTTRTLNENIIAIDFYDPSLMPRGEEIQYNQEWFKQNKINDLKFNFNTKDYRNKQIMLSNEVYSDIIYTESIITDGYNSTFVLENNIGAIDNIKLDGVPKTFTTRDNKELGDSADFYYTPGKNELESDNLIQAGKQIVIQYIPLVEGRQIIYNNTEVNRITEQLNRKGVISRYESRNDILTSRELQKVGESYIKYKGVPEIKLTIETLNNIWDIGEVVYFNSPINNLSTDYMVKSKKIKYIASINEIFYSYELTSSFNNENAINYFDNQRNKAKGNISVGETITRNIDIEKEANIIFENLTIVEYAQEGNNILDCVLDAPLNK